VKTEVGTAEYDRLGNDLFWKYTYIDENRNYYRLNWTGYSDVFWWSEVEPTDRVRILEVGGITRTFELDHASNKVYLLTAEAEK